MRGAEAGEPGILISFDETREEIEADLAALDLPYERLRDEGRVAIHQIDLSDAGARATGAFTLEGLLLQIESLFHQLGGARRVAIDTLEAFLAVADDPTTTRQEIRRLFHWLREKEVTAVVSAESGGDGLTRLGLEEYVSDCVILLDFRVEERIATRRARVLKKRGSAHSGDEHPFVISRKGIQLFPLIRSRLEHEAPAERISSGVAGLDDMLGASGYFRGTSVLVSGTPGAGKTTLAAAFVDGACRRGERAVYFAFEESPHQIVRNMRSVGYDLGRWIDAGLLRIRAQRPSEHGLETHLMAIGTEIEAFEPEVAVLDPFTSLTGIGFQGTTRSMMIRLVDVLKGLQVTTLYTSLGAVDPDAPSGLETGLISSLMDTWVVLEARRVEGARRRFAWILKSRGMGHSDRLHELTVSEDALTLRPAPSLGVHPER